VASGKILISLFKSKQLWFEHLSIGCRRPVQRGSATLLFIQPPI